MKNLFVIFFVILVFWSCDKKSKVEKEVEEIPVSLELHRFEKDFYSGKPENFQNVKAKYPFFFRDKVSDQVWIDKMKDPLWQEVYKEVEKKYGDFSKEETQLIDLFKHLKYYFPKTKIPVTYTLIGEMDYNNKTFYSRDTLMLSLELYLGREHKYYVNDFPAYQRYGFDESQILPDVVSAFADTKIPPAGAYFLDQMIRAGKVLYLKDLMLPTVSDADKINYTKEQYEWSLGNEGYIWRYFVQDNLLYSTDAKLAPRFIAPAPFSKFYLEIDNESPGRIGEFIGWQIVRSYMENNKEVPLAKMLMMDGRQIFEQSKYKPKKTDE